MNHRFINPLGSYLLVLFVTLTTVACGGGGGGDQDDSGGNSATNSAPVANAGEAQTVNELNPVTLSGSGTDPDGSIASYSWSQTEGTAVTLENATSASTSFNAPEVSADETLIFALTVTDDKGSTNSAEVSIHVRNILSLQGKISAGHFSNSNVEATSLSGQVLASVISNDEGEYHLDIAEHAIEQGIIIKASGGLREGEAFAGEMSAIFSSATDLQNVNITLVTSLIRHLSEIEGVTTLENETAAIEKLDQIGMIKASEVNLLASDAIDSKRLLALVFQLGLNEWLDQITDDIQDNQLSELLVAGFPLANGGVVGVSFANNGTADIYREEVNSILLELNLYDDESTNTYSFSLVSTIEGMTISEQGLVTYEPSADVSPGELLQEVIITNLETGKSRKAPLVFEILDSEVVAIGSVDASGGTITNEWEDIVLTVPEGAVTEMTEFRVLRSLSADGRIHYTSKSSTPLLKLTSLRIPSPIIEKASNDSRANNVEKNKSKPLKAGNTQQSRERAVNERWKQWGEAEIKTFAEVKNILVRNPINRLANENSYPMGNISNLKILRDKASALFSLCGEEYQYVENCDGRDPVLFVHGFLVGNKMGGGSGTWGQLPELLHDLGNHAVFEFTWRTSARFVDAAADLSKAILKIEKASGRKVHLIAHSFGGLLARTYLQGYATNSPYMSNVQSLVTIATPHSGIFDEAITQHGVSFPKGQDSLSFEGCLQSSCNQAGEASSLIWKVSKSGSSTEYFDISNELGINKTPGELVANLEKGLQDNAEHRMPVDTKVLMGLTIDRIFLFNRTPENYEEEGGDKYQSGDELITYAGQRFRPSLGDTVTSEASVFSGSGIEVTEKILGAPHGTLPNGSVSVNDAFRGDGERIDFEGYRHSNSNFGQGSAGGFTSRGTIGAAYVGDENNLYDTGAPHEALTEIIAWLGTHLSEQSEPEVFTVNLQVVDASTNQPIEGANVYIVSSDSSVGEGTTDENGQLSTQVFFFANTNYQAIVVADGYHDEEIDNGFVTGGTIEQSDIHFGRITLQPDEVTRSELQGLVIDAVSGLPLSDVTISATRNGISRQAVTDTNGTYHLTDLVVGHYKLVFSKSGFYDVEAYFDVTADTANQGNASLREILAEGTMSIRLTWEENPADLDSHLVKYSASDELLYHIRWNHQNDAASGDNLDRDDTTSYGPETVTINQLDPASRYVYAVYHYSGSGSITETSNAQIRIDYNGDSSVFNAPSSGEGLWWKVFEINAGNIIPCQQDCMMSTPPDDMNPSALSVRKK